MIDWLWLCTAQQQYSRRGREGKMKLYRHTKHSGEEVDRCMRQSQEQNEYQDARTQKKERKRERERERKEQKIFQLRQTDRPFRWLLFAEAAASTADEDRAGLILFFLLPIFFINCEWMGACCFWCEWTAATTQRRRIKLMCICHSPPWKKHCSSLNVEKGNYS